jgi:REP element-mobilizing transposase RayT
MPTGYEIKDQSAAYFITCQVVYWIDLFTRPVYRDVVIESLRYCRKEKGLELFAWVIMSNPVHLLVRSSKNDLSSTIRDFKKYTSKAFVELISISGESRKEWMLRLFIHAAKRQNKSGEFQVWTHENHAIEVYGNSFVQSKVEYMHNNPVRAGLVY